LKSWEFSLRIGGFFWRFFSFLVNNSLGLDLDSTKKNLNSVPESSDPQNWRVVCVFCMISNFLAEIPSFYTRDILGFSTFKCCTYKSFLGY
jgi:hypothetical protein